jgi:hypothetical protein
MLRPDHVTPPETGAPDGNTKALAFDKMVARVPAIDIALSKRRCLLGDAGTYQLVEVGDG